MSRSNKIELLIMTLIAIIAILLFRLYKDGAFKLPSVDDSKIEGVVQPSKVKQYFGNTDDRTIEEMTSPGPNN